MGQLCAGGRKADFSMGKPMAYDSGVETEIGICPWPTQFAELVMETAVLYEHSV